MAASSGRTVDCDSSVLRPHIPNTFIAVVMLANCAEYDQTNQNAYIIIRCCPIISLFFFSHFGMEYSRLGNIDLTYLLRMIRD